MNKEKFPLDFLIMGTMKSGTSSLSSILRTHPVLGIPKHEVHYFDVNLHKGATWYRSLFEAERTENTRLFGEKTPNYSWSEDYLIELQKLAPKVKLIWVFRNPAERTYSHYNHNLRAGRENLSFEKALELEKERIEIDAHYGYRDVSSYATHVQRALRYFPIEQMHFITLESFRANPEVELKAIFDFLGIEASEAMTEYAHSHKTLIPKYPTIRYFVRQQLGYQSRIWNFYHARIMPKEPMLQPARLSQEMRRRLLEELTDEISNLSKLTGLDTSVWK